MIYRRLPLLSLPSGGFGYALAYEDQNFIQVGLGFESPNGLQLTHVATFNMHHLEAHAIADMIEQSAEAGETGLIAGKLSPYFADAEVVQLNPGQMRRMAQMIREVHNEVWDHPKDFELQVCDFENGRFVWLMYGSDIDKVRLGVGFIDEFGDRHIAGHSYAIGKDFAGAFAVSQWRGERLMWYAKPPGWQGRRAFTDETEARHIAVAFLKLADQVWPGEVAPA